jgi:NMD protein affecting ribosome stability and mRNA decay
MMCSRCAKEVEGSYAINSNTLCEDCTVDTRHRFWPLAVPRRVALRGPSEYEQVSARKRSQEFQAN